MLVSILDHVSVVIEKSVYLARSREDYVPYKLKNAPLPNSKLWSVHLGLYVSTNEWHKKSHMFMVNNFGIFIGGLGLFHVCHFLFHVCHFLFHDCHFLFHDCHFLFHVCHFLFHVCHFLFHGCRFIWLSKTFVDFQMYISFGFLLTSVNGLTSDSGEIYYT